jgi:hypothetical protein
VSDIILVKKIMSVFLSQNNCCHKNIDLILYTVYIFFMRNIGIYSKTIERIHMEWRPNVSCLPHLMISSKLHELVSENTEKNKPIL